jgi:small-conductance mechanosensitive channel
VDLAYLRRLLDTQEGFWEPVALGIAMVLLLPIARRFGQRRRLRLGRPLLLFGLHLLCVAIAQLLHLAGLQDQVEWIHVGQHVFAGFVVVSLGSLVIFDVLLPAAGVEMVALSSDLLTGLAYTLAAFAVFGALGVDLTNIVAASTIAAAILSISLQNTLGNVVGGVALQLDGSVHVGDWLQLDGGRQGQVREIGWRHTVVETRDGDTIVVPNATLLSSSLVLLGRRDGQQRPHRITVPFQIDHHHDPEHVISVVTEALLRSPLSNVATSPPPDCILTDLARDYRDGYALYAVRYWIVDLWPDEPTSSAVRARIHAALARAGIPLGRPMVHVLREDLEEHRRRIDAESWERARAAVRAVSLFDVLTEDERDSLAQSLETRQYSSGEIVTRQGDRSNHLYLLLAGEVEVRTEGTTTAVAVLEAPDFFGEMGLLTGEARNASVVARGPVTCYRLAKSSFNTLIHARPDIAAALSARLVQRRMGLNVATGGEGKATEANAAREQARILARIRGFFGLDD